MSFPRPLSSTGWDVPRSLIGIILSAEGGVSFWLLILSGSHQVSKLCVVSSPD